MISKTSHIEEILDVFSKDQINLLSIGEKSGISIEDLIEECNSRDFRVAGGIFPMVIHDNEYCDDGIIVKHIDSKIDPFLVKNIGTENTDFDLPVLSDGIKSSIILLDGLMQNIPIFLDRMYGKYWDRVNYVGAGCGSFSLAQSPCVFTNEGFYQDAAVVLLLENEVGLGVNHGWEQIAGPFVANKTEGNRIIELNWRPALDVYKEAVAPHTNQSFDETEFIKISQGFPFGIKREGMEDVVRDPFSTNENNELVCFGNVDQNAVLNILASKKEHLIESARKASKKAVKSYAPSNLFVVDCITRVMYLEDDFTKELDAVKKVFSENNCGVPIEGVLSLGEISSDASGYLDMYNKTIVVSAFY